MHSPPTHLPSRSPLARRILVACVLAGALAGCSSKPSAMLALMPPRSVGSESADPAVAIDPATGDLLVAWLGGEGTDWRLLFARSKDRGVSWSDPIVVSPPGEPLRPQP